MKLPDTGGHRLAPKALPRGSQDGRHGGPQFGGDRRDVLALVSTDSMTRCRLRGKTYLNSAGRVEGHTGFYLAAEAAKRM